jgi:hypothetical protein
MFAIDNEAAVSPANGEPSFLHWYVKVPCPDATTVKTAVVVAHCVTATGCVPIDVAVFNVSDAAAEVAELHVPVTTTV